MTAGPLVRLLRRKALSALALLAAASTATAQAPSSGSKLRPTDGGEREITPPAGIVPFATGPSIRVVVELAGASVAAAQAAALAPLSRAEKDQVARGHAQEHSRVSREVHARGGRVLATFSHAVNGVKADVPASAIPQLQALPGVVAVRRVQVFTHDQAAQPDNAMGVPFVGATAAWGGATGFHGEAVKVAIIDSGIDYTHANFGGPGTAAAYDSAFANGALPADPSVFGPSAPKVKGGIDLVGDAYDAAAAAGSPALVPHPDPNPLDCGGHGSHVAGTVAGFGVTGAGSTYTGIYDANTIASNAWTIGPGVAPRADLYAVRVFGCDGSTDVVVDAIDWAVKNDVDVINMSLGSPFGSPDSADAVAAEAAAKAGVIVVTSAGNSGHAPYITGAPGVGDRVVSTAAIDVAVPTLPMATLAIAGGATVNAQVSNGAPVPTATLGVVYLPPAAGTTYSGCSASEYANVAGKVVVAVRGSCARVDRAILGQAAGAAAVVLVNNAPGYGVYEYEIPGVTIPFLGVDPKDRAALAAAAEVTLAAAPSIPNPGFQATASFSSGGPRRGDSKLKPSVTAPGVAVNSTWVGTGNLGARMSGTSMASPHVAGVAALAVQAHPRWKPTEVRAAILGTALPGSILDYEARLSGAGAARADRAAATQVVALAQSSSTMNLSFGFAELDDGAFDRSDEIEVKNLGRTSATFDVVIEPTSATPHTATAVPSRITVRAGESTGVKIRLVVPAATAGDTAAFRDVAGIVKLEPTSASSNGGIALRVPYYLVSRARSRVAAEAATAFGPSSASATIQLRNAGVIPGSADFYAWGPSGTRDPSKGEVNLRALGVQSFDVGNAATRLVVFAVNTFGKFNTAANAEFDVALDVNGDGRDDYIVFSYDYGAMTAGVFSGTPGTFVYNVATGRISVSPFYASAPEDGSTVLLPVYAHRIGLSPANPRFSYYGVGWGWEGQVDVTNDVGYFNPFSSAIETGGWSVVDPKGRITVGVGIDGVEWARSPPTGLMIVNVDDRSGKEQAELVRATGR